MTADQLALVERILYAEQDSECRASARQMMAAALSDVRFDWAEAGQLAAWAQDKTPTSAE